MMHNPTDRSLAFYFRATVDHPAPHRHPEMLQAETTKLILAQNDRLRAPEINAAQRGLTEAAELRFDGCALMRGGRRVQTALENDEAVIDAFRVQPKTELDDADFHCNLDRVEAPAKDFVISIASASNFFASTTKVISKICLARDLFANHRDMRLTVITPRKVTLPGYFRAMVDLFHADDFKDIRYQNTLDVAEFITPINAIPGVFQPTELQNTGGQKIRRRVIGGAVRLLSQKVAQHDWSADHTPPLPKRIMISRARAKQRTISNLADWMPFFAGHGFEEVAMEDHSVADQIRLIRNAQIVLGPHGAGMAHLAFAGPDTTFIELTTRQFVKRGANNFAPIAELNAVPYHLVCCNEDGDPTTKMVGNNGNDLLLTDAAIAHIQSVIDSAN
ncbi:glycosyltransferase family 61 protein [Yoonia sp. SS1-5]|uniref:DUF563 domain-containing protein n=1 Tax=Yoonia rhodophyticola TaxID=3137370 RepID=A0AAN0M8D7_9RHOB